MAPTSPPTTRRKTSTIEVGSNFGGMIEYYPVSEISRKISMVFTCECGQLSVQPNSIIQ